MYTLKTIDKLALEIVADRFESKRNTERFFNDPVAWANYMLGATLWSKQREISMSLATDRNIAVKAGHGVGKSFLVSLLTCWWIDTRYPDVYVASTAPSIKQISAVVWREIGLMKEHIEQRFKDGEIDHKLPGYITADNVWKTDTGTWIGMGTRPPEQKEESAVQGIHAKYVLALGDEACHDKETDVLTKDGWKNWTQVTEEDEFLTWDTDNSVYEYLKAERLVAYHYEGEMYHYTNKETDFMVTPNHEMVFETSINRGVFKRAEMQDIVLSNKSMKRNLDFWQGEHPEDFVIPAWQGKRKFYPEYRFKATDWAAFMGWVGSEGSLSKAGYDIRIWQVKEQYRVEIKALLERMGLNYVEDTDHYRIGCGRLAKFVAESGRTTLDKRVPDYVKTWSKELISIYLDAYAKGDGYYRQHGVRVIYTSGVDMANDLQELALKAGYGSTLTTRPPTTSQPMECGRRITSHRTGYVITVSEHNRSIRLRKDALKKVDYSDMVYCATMPKNNTLFTRRRGKTLWSGNCGLSEEMIDALSNITSNEFSRRILIGNPTNPGSFFAKIFKMDTGTWRLHTISVLDSPHFTEEKHELPESVLSKLTNVEYYEDKKRDYGEDSPRFKARILGEFAYDLGDTIIKESDVNVAIDAEFFIPSDGTRRILGCDIARFGDDSSVVYLAEVTPEGTKRLRLLSSWAHDARTTESSNRIHKLARDYAVQEVRVDGHGIGGGVIDNLLQLEGNYHVIDMNSNATTNDKKQWHNARAYWWDMMGVELRTGQIDIDLEDERLRDELCSVEYKYAKQTGGMLVESKDDMRKRGQKSPDFADAAIYACADMSHLFEQDVNSLPAGTILDLTNDYDYEPDWYIEGMI